MTFARFWAVALTALLPAALPAQKPAFQFAETDQGVLVSEGESKVLFYQRAPKSLDGRFTRAHYVHPLYDLDGHVLTEDFPADHLHHRGIFWAWHQVWVGDVRAGDPWVCQDFQWDVRSVTPRMCANGTAELRADVVWKSPRVTDEAGQPRPLVDETAVVRIHPADVDTRVIDVSFALRALVPQLRIGGSEDEKGYGGFCWRIDLPQDIRFVSSGGDVQPRTTAVEAGPWLDCVGSLGDGVRQSGLAVLCHPTAPGHVQPWILRERRSMQNAVWPGREPVVLPQDQPLVFHYRMIIHRGDTKAASIADRYDAFAREQPQLGVD